VSQGEIALPFNAEHHLRSSKFSNWVFNNASKAVERLTARRAYLRPLKASVQHQHNGTDAHHCYPPLQLPRKPCKCSYDYRVIHDGIAFHRTQVRQRGGLIAVGTSLAISLLGLLLVALPGSLFGVLGFLLLLIALPVLPMLGVPAVSSNTTYLLAFFLSMVLWFAVGHVSALRATRKAVSGWPEWIQEFRPFAIGIWVGALLSLAISTVVLGAL